MAAAKRGGPNVVPDVGVTIGPYRIQGRTDGKWILFLEGQPPGKGTVGTPHKTRADAEAAAKAMVALTAATAAKDNSDHG